MDEKIEQAVEILKDSGHTTAYTGAGISVESGIPPFRGEGGLWSKYDPRLLEINYFHSNPAESWAVIKKMFYDFFHDAGPNDAHYALANMEMNGYLKAIITQNVDNLHQEAGSKCVFEFHGNSHTLICTKCNKKYRIKDIDLKNLPPLCSACNSFLKPDFIFFGEGIPEPAASMSFAEAEIADVFLIIGSTGEVAPAAMIPVKAKQNGAKIIEINTTPSLFTNSVTDIFLQGKATEVMKRLLKELTCEKYINSNT